MRKSMEWRHCSGQAVVEFVVLAAFVLVAMLLALTTLARFEDVRNKVLMGSRYVAWERTVWLDGPDVADTDEQRWYGVYGGAAKQAAKPDHALLAEVAARIAVSRDMPIRGSDGTAVDADRLPAMWHDHAGAVLTRGASSMTVHSRAGAIPDPGLAARVDPLARLGDRAFGEVRDADGQTVRARLDLPVRNLRHATVAVEAGADSEALRQLWPTFQPLRFADTTALLSNTWVAEGLRSGEALFAQAVPAAHADLAGKSRYGKLARYAPEIDRLEFGRIAPHVVPNDRSAAARPGSQP